MDDDFLGFQPFPRGLAQVFDVNGAAPTNESELVLIDDWQEWWIRWATIAEYYFLLILLTAPPETGRDGLMGLIAGWQFTD